jgi:polyisoprenoid-binding protein YceI
MKRIYIAALILIASANIGLAQVKSNISKSKITFEIKNLGFKTGGTIGGVQGNVAFDPANLSGSKIDATADATTLDTDNDLRNEHIKGEKFFNVAVYPKISMSSTAFKSKGGNNYTGTFNITIKGKTKPVELPFSYTAAGSTALLKGSFKIKRSDFGIGGSSMTLSDEATIFIETESAK